MYIFVLLQDVPNTTYQECTHIDIHIKKEFVFLTNNLTTTKKTNITLKNKFEL